LAVLAFANLTGDAGSDFVADGIAEELITTLSRTTKLRIPARTSSFAYRGRATDVRTIGRELGVGAVLEGSVRKSGDRIRVTAQLIEAQSGYHLWAQNFERTDGDLLSLQDDLAAAIARVLHTQIGPSHFRTHDPEAFRLNMQGRALSARITPENLNRAVELQQQALSRDPGYADCWTGLAGTLMVGTMTGAFALDRRFEARTIAEEAIRLDRGAASPYAIRAVLDAAAGRWLDAEAGFAAALELDDSNPVGRAAMALHLLGPAGHVDAARRQMLRAIADGPADGNLHVTLAAIAVVAGDQDAARTGLDVAQLMGVPADRNSVQIVRSDLARMRGQWDVAGALAARAVDQWPGLAETGAGDMVRSVFDIAAGVRGDEAPREALLAIAERGDTDSSFWRIPAAGGLFMFWQVLAGSIDNAYAIGDKLVETWQRTGHLAGVGLSQIWRTEMQPFREDPRFDDFVVRLGFAPLWHRIGRPVGYSQLTDGAKDRGAGGTAAG
jgi:TolB-like protein